MSAYLRADGIDVEQQRGAFQGLSELAAKNQELIVEGGLAAASFAPPPFGTAADLASVGRSVWKGNWGDAFFDVVGLVPLGGDAIKAGRLANKVADVRRSLDAAQEAMTASLKRTKDAAGRYWDDAVAARRADYDEAIRKCGGDRKCMDNKASMKGPQYGNTPREFDRKTGERNGHWLDADGNPAERGDGFWHPNGGTGQPVEYKNGFPDFGPHSAGTVEIPMRGNHVDTPGTGDYGVAEQAWLDSGRELPDGYDEDLFTWHHHQDGVSMELVPRDVHSTNRHMGGASLHSGGQAESF